MGMQRYVKRLTVIPKNSKIVALAIILKPKIYKTMHFWASILKKIKWLSDLFFGQCYLECWYMRSYDNAFLGSQKRN